MGRATRPRGRSFLAAWIAGPLLAPLLVGLVLRLVLIAVPVRPVWDGVIYARSADFIAHGLGYTRTAIDPDEPGEATAFYPVGFPAMLAPLRWLRVGRGLDLFAQALAGALLVAAAGVLGRRAAGPRVGRRAAWLVALWPGGVLLSGSWLSEPFFALFVAAAALVFAYARRRSTLRATAIAAVILAVGALVRPTAIPILLACAIGLALFASRTAGPRLALSRVRLLSTHLVTSTAIVAVVIAPWAMRNAVSLDGPALVSTNGGANLLVGTLNLGSFARIPDEIDCPGTLTEVARDRCRSRVAVARIADAPLDWAARGVLKVVNTFGHESAPAQAWGTAVRLDDRTTETVRLWALAIDRAWWLVFLSGSLAGAVILQRTRPRSSLRIAVFAPILALAALHFVFLGGDRYHAPIVPLMAVLAALALDAAQRARAPAVSQSA